MLFRHPNVDYLNSRTDIRSVCFSLSVRRTVPSKLATIAAFITNDTATWYFHTFSELFCRNRKDSNSHLHISDRHLDTRYLVYFILSCLWSNWSLLLFYPLRPGHWAYLYFSGQEGIQHYTKQITAIGKRRLA